MADKINFMGNKPLNEQSNMPKIADALSCWHDKIVAGRINISYNDGDKVESVENVIFSGLIQPLSAKQIALKPEGQRAWEWLQIHDYSLILNFDTDDKFLIGNKKYKVMGKKDYSRNNYIEYHIIEDYE